MGIIKNEDLAMARVEEQLVCQNCLTKEELSELKEGDIVTQDEIDKTDDFYFCDRCERRN